MTRLLHSLSTLRAAIADDDARLASGGWLVLTGLGVITHWVPMRSFKLRLAIPFS